MTDYSNLDGCVLITLRPGEEKSKAYREWEKFGKPNTVVIDVSQVDTMMAIAVVVGFVQTASKIEEPRTVRVINPTTQTELEFGGHVGRPREPFRMHF